CTAIGDREYGYDSVLVLGHSEYYPKFGFKLASEWNIKPPFSAPDDAFMAIELKEGALQNKEGTAVFPEEYNIIKTILMPAA
ncbi:hypothetical protein ACFLTD_02900, partial [Elusimicrobiota bacterium]